MTTANDGRDRPGLVRRSEREAMEATRQGQTGPRWTIYGDKMRRDGSRRGAACTTKLSPNGKGEEGSAAAAQQQRGRTRRANLGIYRQGCTPKMGTSRHAADRREREREENLEVHDGSQAAGRGERYRRGTSSRPRLVRGAGETRLTRLEEGKTLQRFSARRTGEQGRGTPTWAGQGSPAYIVAAAATATATATATCSATSRKLQGSCSRWGHIQPMIVSCIRNPQSQL